MSLDRELQDLFGRIQNAPWPGEHQAFDQFLRRKHVAAGPWPPGSH